MRSSHAHDVAVAVRVLLAALLGLYWSSSRVEGNHRELKSSLASQMAFSGAVHSACTYLKNFARASV